MAATAVGGVLLSVDDARFLAASLGVLDKLARQRGLAVQARVVELANDLASAAQDSESRTPEPWTELLVPQSVTDDLIGASEAARRLACTPENVRALCRRGVLPAVWRAGRWLIPAQAVADRLARSNHAS